ncbi:helix-turn-helix domain-containing protein [Paenibacillus sp. MMS20-IR301]|uniref:helix-turn-helix domain-containing protein n=1 Tax=Paenibacillus sp. MMS20-IR301 TaxID=2895946 RepID=UPI0028E9A210|nr:helix-turn-helix domain-containing protein [Paenibacillus sp. MMS20-IR301]WNS42930.1 helix-turn-helix domain-containing protein [Paenibacillus sp. MMS20-IR301]
MHLGPVIKRVRTSKGIRQSVLADGIMSRSNLSRFEGGKYYPGYDKLILLLDKLEMSLEELLFLHYEYAQPVKRSLHLSLVEAANRYEFGKVRTVSHECRSMYEETGTEAYHHLYLLGQGFLLRYQREDEIGQLSRIAGAIKPYLLGVDRWFLYEFKLLNNFLFTLSSGDAVFFGNRAAAEFEKYQDFAESRTVKQHLMKNIATVCLKEHNYGQSLYFLSKALPLADKTNLLYDKIETLVYYEVTLLCLKQKDSPAELLNYLNILRQLEFTDSYEALKQVCRRHLPDVFDT